jgi:hypothetical protein
MPKDDCLLRPSMPRLGLPCRPAAQVAWATPYTTSDYMGTYNTLGNTDGSTSTTLFNLCVHACVQC